MTDTKRRIRRDGDRTRLQTEFKNDGKTQQHFRDSVDVNKILKNYDRTGQITHLAKTQPRYGDFSSGMTYHEAYDQVLAAQDSFDRLPAELRLRMGNDPGILLEFIHDEENFEEAVKLGLVEDRRPPVENPTEPDPTPEKPEPGTRAGKPPTATA